MKENNIKGFTLLEVIISIVIFSTFSVASFYYFSNSMKHHEKLEEKYVLLRMVKEFVENFESSEKMGSEEKEGFIIKWRVTEVEDQRKIISRGSLDFFLQLRAVHLEVINNRLNKQVFSTAFFCNLLLAEKK